MSSAARIVIGLVIGALVGAGAFVAWGQIGSDAGPVAAATTSTTLPPIVEEAPWVDGGSRFRTTVIVPQAFVVNGTAANLEFEIVPLTPGLDGDDDGDDRLTPIHTVVRPERWQLELADGTVIEGETDSDDLRLSFELPEGTARTDITELRIVTWRYAAPLGSTVELAVEPDSTGTFDDGTVVTIETVLAQANSTIVRLTVEHPDDSWHGASSFGIAAADPGWRRSGGPALGSELQFIRDGGGTPHAIVLFQDHPAWMPLAEELVVDLGGGA